MNENPVTDNMELLFPTFKIEINSDGLFVGQQTTEGKNVLSSQASAYIDLASSKASLIQSKISNFAQILNKDFIFGKSNLILLICFVAMIDSEIEDKQ